MRKIIAEIGRPITLGRIGENETTTIVFNLSRVAIPNATYSLIHKRHGDETSYPCETYIENGNLCWEIKSSDVAVVGMGECEVLAIVDEKIAKDEIYTTRVLKALDDNIGEVPPPYQPWVDSVLKEFAFSHKLDNITCRYISIPHSAEPHCDSEETDDGLILTFYIPQGEQGEKGDKGDDYILTEEDKEEIASKVHYDDSELREMIDRKASIIMLHSELNNGTWSIKNADGEVLTYADIKALHNKEDYIVCLHQNVIHSTSFLTDAIEFIGTYYINDSGHISRLIINDANVVKADGYALENAENRLDDLTGYEVGDIPSAYPSADAVVEYIKDGNNLPKSTLQSYGVTKTKSVYGISVNELSELYTVKAEPSDIDARTNRYKSIVPYSLDYAVKQALTDGKGAEYSVEEKKSARERIGAEGGGFELIEEITLSEDSVLYLNTEPNGNPYNFKKIRIIWQCPTLTAQKTIYFSINNPSFQWTKYIGTMQIGTTGTPNGMIDANVSNGYIDGKYYVTTGNINQNASWQSIGINASTTKVQNIESIVTIGTVPSGSNIKIYGIRA